MLVDFGALPPEINATRLYAGPGSGPMWAAATAWQTLANELGTAAAKYQAQIAGLANTWHGVAGQQMAAAAASHIRWLTTTAGSAEQTGAHATAQALAYETARAATTPPPVIAANRSLQASLIATNVLGQNTAAIMATETLYLEMWAQCAAAMYGYAAATEQSSALPHPTPARQTTNPAGAAHQTAALLNTADTTAVNSPVDLTGTGADSAKLLSESLRGPFFAMGTVASGAGFLRTFGNTGALSSSAISGANGMMLAPATAAFTAGPGLSAAMGATPATSAPITASLTSATRLGGLSVPASWAGSTPTTNATLGALSGGNAASGLAGAAKAPADTVGGVPLSGAGAAGRGIGDGVVRTGPRAFTMPRPMSAG
ncbi:PPE family protein [Mycobacterium koreense]|uniref:PPE family protein n=1 Tax=Mycolicibacillus koreensis TaxID=1069220 RepID=A0A7I7SI33_9MYCO|nr:PPE family protein [Mycolicibacillus koreensis]MCV7248634.1 PPE family protein [Mycolicibacillus koreensis]ODR11869.1 hypothetical protein BHQ15_01455 [Mycolicibacillus koreensis]OSC34010.1 PPE family protein [Mycolicibacillus koreensis]BBY55596.1 PPE family protein PPE15 [Mycolicibacillus koreensis]